MCLQIYDPASGEYWADQPGIRGLSYQPGFVWQVLVEQAGSPSPAAWTVTQVVAQEVAAGEVAVTSPHVGEAFRAGEAVRGKVSAAPSDRQLVYRVYDAGGTLIGQGPIAVTPADAGSGSFESVIQFAEYEGPGRIEILDLYSSAGFVGRSASVDLYLGMTVPPESRPSAQVLESRSIHIDSPARYSVAPPTFEVRGRVSLSPFENTLGYHVFGADGRLLNAGSLMVQAELGQPGTFASPIAAPASYRGPVRLLIFEGSAADGLILASATLDLFVDGGSLP
ncbi:MAG: hypothetical protein NTY23_02860 [Chloroflexi bacterium]|nr:hypothetical protein [Chloroflexota bacterium]